MKFQLFILLHTVLLMPGPVGARHNDSLVTIQDGRFFRAGKPYYFMGTNYWYGAIACISPEGRERVQKELDFMKAQGISNVRVLAAAEGSGPINGMRRAEPAYQVQAGKFDSTVLKGLDYFMHFLRQRGMTATLYLTNNWDWSGGFLQYLNWYGHMADSVLKRKLSWDENRDIVSRFYDCMPCKNAYLQQVTNLVSRKNSITLSDYKDDPSILSWELANEPRPMRPAAVVAFTSWVDTSTRIIKRLDSQHLVTTGSEGQMGSETMEVFRTIHALPAVDYATIHIWPKNWGWFSDTSIAASLQAIISNSDHYIRSHATVMQKLKKPLVIEEFGLPRDEHGFSIEHNVTLRNRYYQSVFTHLLDSHRRNEGIMGTNFWAFGGSGRPSDTHVFWQPGDDLLGDPPQEEQGLNTVFDADSSTWRLIRQVSFKLQ